MGFYTVSSKFIRRKILHSRDKAWLDIITNCKIKSSRKGFLDASLMWSWLELWANFITPVKVLCNNVFIAHTYIWCLFIDLFLNLWAALKRFWIAEFGPELCFWCMHTFDLCLWCWSQGEQTCIIFFTVFTCVCFITWFRTRLMLWRLNTNVFCHQ